MAYIASIINRISLSHITRHLKFGISCQISDFVYSQSFRHKIKVIIPAALFKNIFEYIRYRFIKIYLLYICSQFRQHYNRYRQVITDFFDSIGCRNIFKLICLTCFIKIPPKVSNSILITVLVTVICLSYYSPKNLCICYHSDNIADLRCVHQIFQICCVSFCYIKRHCSCKFIYTVFPRQISYHFGYIGIICIHSQFISRRNRSKVLHCMMNVFLNSVIPYSRRFFFSAV